METDDGAVITAIADTIANPNLAGTAKRTAADNDVLEALITGLAPNAKKTTIRKNSFKVLILRGVSGQGNSSQTASLTRRWFDSPAGL